MNMFNLPVSSLEVHKNFMRSLIPLSIIIAVSLGWASFPVSTQTTHAQTREKRTSGPETAAAVIEKQAVRSYLQEVFREPSGDQKAFADYYMFGHDQNKLFIWAYIAEYSMNKGELKLVSGQSLPLILTLSLDGSITDHWQPRPGERYTESIKEHFPPMYHHDVLTFQTRHQEILSDLKNSVNKIARESMQSQNRMVLSPGEVQALELEANRTTGYTWSYTIRDKDIIKVVSDEYKEHDSEDNVLGAGGKRVLHIKALAEGITVIHFRYYRDWNPEDIAAERTFRIQVKRKQDLSFNCPERPEL